MKPQFLFKLIQTIRQATQIKIQFCTYLQKYLQRQYCIMQIPSTTQGDKYQLVQEIDSGYSGKVYKAKDQHNNWVAIKKYFDYNANVDSIQNQYNIVKNLNHEHIVKVIDILLQAIFKQKGKCQPCHAIVMQFIDGRSLYDFVVIGGKLSQKLTRTYFTQLVDVLHYLHKKEYVHQDIKPHNILLTKEYALKLIDFGFAKKLESKNQKLKERKGSQSYMAPEIYKGEYNPIKTDLFALGVTLFFMYTGQTPFQNANNSNSQYILVKKNMWDRFWKIKQNKSGEREGYFSIQFKGLFQKLVCFDDTKRLSIEEINKHDWMKSEISEPHEIIEQLNKKEQAIKQKLAQEQKNRKRQKKLKFYQHQQEEGVIPSSNQSQQSINEIPCIIKLSKPKTFWFWF